jgi:hypothetical protein
MKKSKRGGDWGRIEAAVYAVAAGPDGVVSVPLVRLPAMREAAEAAIAAGADDERLREVVRAALASP